MRRWFSLFLTLALLLSLLPGTTLAAGEQAPVEDTPEVVEVQPEVPAEVPPEPVVPEEDVELLASGNASVNGTISLPNGASALNESNLFVYLCTPAVLDEDGQVLAEPVTVKSSRVDFAQGQSSGSFSISGVEAGEYILRAYSYVSSGAALGGLSGPRCRAQVTLHDMISISEWSYQTKTSRQLIELLLPVKVQLRGYKDRKMSIDSYLYLRK